MTAAPLVRLDAVRLASDSARLGDWLRRPHVVRWWGAASHLDQIVGRPHGSHAIIVADGRRVGYVCWQRPSAEELVAAALTDLPHHLVDIDIMIGEPDVLGRGVGAEALRLLVIRLASETDFAYAGLGTSVQNARAIRAFEKAGFERFRAFDDPEFGRMLYLIAPLPR